LLEETIKKYLPNPFEVYDKALAATRNEVTMLMDKLHVKEFLQGWISEIDKDVDVFQSNPYLSDAHGNPVTPTPVKQVEKKEDDSGFIFDDEDDSNPFN
jgi:hypothetical protein